MSTSSPEPIICRPTTWFVCRAGIIFLMFAVFAVLFYIDGSSGYRKKNEAYYLHQCFKEASGVFADKNADQQLTEEEWREFVILQKVEFPNDPSILPSDISLPMPWPKILHDYDRMKSLQWNQLWLDYTEIRGFDSNPPEKAYDARSLREQWIFCVICSSLATVALFFIVRTSRRSIVATEDCIISQNGRSVPYSDFHRLDLRKWENKGIARAEYNGSAGKGYLRIDGLTYGGFKKDHGQPANKLMQRLRENFSGELLEYTAFEKGEEPHDGSAEKSNPEV